MMVKVPAETIVDLVKYKNDLFGHLNQKSKAKLYLPISKTGGS